MKRKYAVHQIHFLVDRYHVSTRNLTIARDLVRRVKLGITPSGERVKGTESWSHGQLNMAIKDAIKRHEQNRSLYIGVVSGRI